MVKSVYLDSSEFADDPYCVSLSLLASILIDWEFFADIVIAGISDLVSIFSKRYCRVISFHSIVNWNCGHTESSFSDLAYISMSIQHPPICQTIQGLDLFCIVCSTKCPWDTSKHHLTSVGTFNAPPTREAGPGAS